MHRTCAQTMMKITWRITYDIKKTNYLHMNIERQWLCAFLFVFISTLVLAQGGSENGDAILSRLYDQQNFYLSQIKKAYLPDTLKYSYKQKLAEVEKQINEQYQENIKQLQNYPNTSQLIEEEKRKQEYRALDLEMMQDLEPDVYANEIHSWNIYGGVGFGGIGYSYPISLGINRVLNQKISVGLLVQHFSQNIQVTSQDDSLTSYTIYSSQYKYSYNSCNARLDYHLTIPALSFEHFDVYVSALLGYNLASHPKTIIEPDTVASPTRSGLNFGAMAGIRYMADKNIGFYSELGYSRNTYISIGVVYRIVPPYEKKEKITREDKAAAALEEAESGKTTKGKADKNKKEKSSSSKEKSDSKKSSSKEADKKEKDDDKTKPDVEEVKPTENKQEDNQQENKNE